MVNFNPTALAPYFRMKWWPLTPTATPPQLLMPARSSRVLFLASCTSGDYTLWPGPAIPVTAGIDFVGGSSPFIAEFSKWGGVVGLEWWYTAMIGQPGGYALEVWYEPPGE